MYLRSDTCVISDAMFRSIEILHSDIKEQLFTVVTSMLKVLNDNFGDDDHPFQETLNDEGEVIRMSRGSRRRRKGYPTPVVVACLLDKRTNGNGIPPEHLENAWSMTLKLLKKSIDRSKYSQAPEVVDVDIDDSTEEPSEEEGGYNIWNSTQQNTESTTRVALSYDDIERLVDAEARGEIEKYKARPRIDHKQDPLLWWREAEATGDFPNLSKLARKYLCVPATSAAVERVFSYAGNIISDERGRLDPTFASQLIFLRIAWKAIEVYDTKDEGKRTSTSKVIHAYVMYIFL